MKKISSEKEEFVFKGETFTRITFNGELIGWEDSSGKPLVGMVAKLLQGEYAYCQIETQMANKEVEVKESITQEKGLPMSYWIAVSERDDAIMAVGYSREEALANAVDAIDDTEPLDVGFYFINPYKCTKRLFEDDGNITNWGFNEDGLADIIES